VRVQQFGGGLSPKAVARNCAKAAVQRLSRLKVAANAALRALATKRQGGCVPIRDAIAKEANEGPGDIEARLRKLLANFAPSAKRVSVASIVESLP
jgi:hypothetical protein